MISPAVRSTHRECGTVDLVVSKGAEYEAGHPSAGKAIASMVKEH